MFGLFKKKPKEPVMVNVKKITAKITTIDGREFDVSEEGRECGFLFHDRIIFEASRSLLYERRVNEGFFRVARGMDVPVCNIKDVSFQIVDYFVEASE